MVIETEILLSATRQFIKIKWYEVEKGSPSKSFFLKFSVIPKHKNHIYAKKVQGKVGGGGRTQPDDRPGSHLEK